MLECNRSILSCFLEIISYWHVFWQFLKNKVNMDLNYNKNYLAINTTNVIKYFSISLFGNAIKISAISIVFCCFLFLSIAVNAQLPYTATQTAGMTYYPGTALSTINDGNISTIGANNYEVHPTNAIGKTITMAFSNNVNISSAIFYNRANSTCCINRIAGAQMIFKDVVGNVLYTFTFPASNGNVQNINNPLGLIVGVRTVELTNFQLNPQNFREIEFLGVSALPVELVSFQVGKEEGKVNLKWVTATEINNDGFEIQHSVNGIDFENIGWEKGFGNTNKTQYYEFHHGNPKEVNYYRLKQIDFDGQFEYSPIRSVKIENEYNGKIIELYPNPAQNEITLNGLTEFSDVKIYNLMGENVTDKIEFIKNGEQILVINLSLLSNGIYYIKTKTATKKFIKQ